MNPLNPGLLSAYNSLTDKHLAGYFSNTRIRRHLQRAGLITRSGRIVPDKEYRHKLIQRTHQRHVRECLAQAIFHKVLEMERLHQIEIKRKLEEFARRERVHKIKLERSRRYEEDIIRILSPRPPTGARAVRKQHSGPEGEHSESSESLGSSRPNTAPGKMQRPVRLKPIHSNSTTATLRRSSPYRLLKSANDNEQLLYGTESRRRLTTKETTSGISPYCLPVINNFVTPVPPATKRKERVVKVTPSGTLRGRRLRPTTSTSVADVIEDRPVLRSSVHQSRVSVNMVYFGKTVHLSHDMIDMRDEVKVFQQHCGGENLCVYKGKLREGESFQFVSRRHRGFPFSLTFFLNGIQVERLSSCCEFKHRKGSRLGGRHGHFGLSCVEGASPCYKCIIAMGLDKKPTPPPKRVKEEGGSDESFSSPKDAAEMETGRTGEDTSSHSDCETRQGLIKEEEAPEEDKARDDYEEDFEADDEGPVEDEQEKTALSPASEKESQVKERDTSETPDDEKDEDIKSHSGSSCSSSDQEVSDAEDTRDSTKDEEAELHEEDSQEVSIAPPDEKEKLSPEEEAAATEGRPGLVRDSDLQRSAEDNTEVNISDTSVPSGRDHSISEEKETESGGDEGKLDEEERDNFVQDKITESQISCEPKLTDPSTEEHEATDEGHEQDNQVLVPEKSVTFEEQEQTLAEETTSEESAKVGETEVVQVQEDTSEPTKEDNGTKTELHENSDSGKDEAVEREEEDEKPASEEDVEGKDKPEDMGAGPQPVSEENMSEEQQTSEAQEAGGGECTDTNTAPQDEEQEEKSADAAEADTQPQEAKSSDADVSSVSELVKNTDDKAASENEEEVMTVTKTMEMKAEPSEEQEPLSCEEAPVNDREEKQQGDNTDRPAAPQTAVTADESSSSVDVSRESVVENTADIKEDNAKDEDIEDDVREEENEEEAAAAAAAAGASNGGSQQQELEEEQTEKSVEINSVTERETSKEEEKQSESDELAQGESGDGKERNETDIKEENRNECKADEKEENMVEDTETDEKQPSDKPAGENAEEEDEVVHEEKASESEKTGGDEFGGSDEDENKDEDDESRAKEVTPDQTNEGEEINEPKAELDKAEEEEEKDDNGTKAEQSEQGDKEPEGENFTTCKSEGGEGISEMTEEPEKNTDNVKTSDENTAESEDVGYNEVAGVDKTTEEMSNNVVESEDAKKETDGAGSKSEKGDIDAENGEISNRAERENRDDQTEASNEDKTDVKTAERTEDEETTEQALTQEECTEEPGDDGEGESELEIIGTETNTENKPDTGRGESEDTQQGENCSTADHNNEKGDSYSTKNNNCISDMFDACSADQTQSLTPTGLGATALKLDEFTVISDKHSHTNENSAADGENGADVEEASKASEEGASVLLKPQATNDEADIVERGITIAAETPEVLVREDKTDLVTNWVNMHQESKFFKTFVEPFEELEDDASCAQVSSSRKEETTSAEQQRLESPLKMTMTPKSEENEQKDESKNREKNNMEANESDPESEPSKGEPHENDQDNSGFLDKEETEVRDIIIQKTASEESDKDSTKRQRKGSKGSLEEDELDNEENKVQDEPVLSDIFKTEVESIAGTHHSAASGKPKSDTEEQSEEKTIDHGPDSNEKQTEIEETKSLVPASKTEEHPERSVSPDGLKDTQETWEKTDGLSGDVTEITDFATSKSDDGSQGESHDGGMQPRVSDGSASKGLIQDIKHTLSKDRLSSFPVDETLFGHSSYASLNAARTESLH